MVTTDEIDDAIAMGVPIAIENLREGINAERRFVIKAHNLSEKMNSIELIFGHMDISVSDTKKHFHQFLGPIIDNFLVIRSLIASYETEEIHIIQKEVVEAKKRQWRLVRKLEEKETVLEKQELIKLHDMFNKLFRLMDKHKLIKALEEDFSTKKEIEKYEKAEHYYLSQIFKFVRAYERILGEMIE